MKSYNLTAQEKPDFCMPSVIQALLRRRGHELTQEEIARALNFNPKDLCSFENLAPFLKTFDLDRRIFYYNSIPLNDLEIFLQEVFESSGDLIVGKRIIEAGQERKHVYLGYDFKTPDLYLIDPSNAQRQVKDAFEIERDMWEKQEGVYCLIK